MTHARRPLSAWREGLFAGVLIASAVVALSAQAVTVSTAGGTLRVRALRWAFIEGEVLDRLRDGRALRFDFELTVLAAPGGSAATAARLTFNLSFDLWEERFAVTRVGTPPRSVSHLKTRDAEAWCLENLTLPVSEISRFSPDVPFWIRLAYRVQDPVSAEDQHANQIFTLRRLIDFLSRQRQDRELGKSVEAGPFRLSD